MDTTPSAADLTLSFDAVVVGASVAGCTTATLLARGGASVALVEKAPALDHHKRMCTHVIQPGARGVLQRLGVEEEIDAAGGVPNDFRIVTPHGTATTHGSRRGWNVRRAALDPILRRAAADERGVDLRTGLRVSSLLRDQAGQIVGVRGRTRDGDCHSLLAPVVVAADGRSSGLARLAQVPGRVLRNDRMLAFGYLDHVAGVTPGENTLWLRDPDVNYLFPHDRDGTLVACMVDRRRFPAFRRDPWGSLLESFDGLPVAEAVGQATQDGPVLLKLDLENVRRPAARGRIAFVGDAAQQCDPLWGVGIGFALQSGALLADALGPALKGRQVIDRALDRYRQAHRNLLLGHYLQTSWYSRGAPMSPLYRMLFSTAEHHPPTSRLIAGIAARERPLHDPALLRDVGRTTIAAARGRLRARPGRRSSRLEAPSTAEHRPCAGPAPRSAEDVPR